jgi:CO/xanthine dehydrogenase Mo-binding subunit
MAASYYNEGVSLPKTPRPGQEPEPWGKTRVVGTRMRRVDDYERVSGAAVYYDDISLPGMLYGAVLRCPHANAIVKNVDTSAAERMPGVHAVIHGGSPEAKQYKPIGTFADPTAMRELFPSHCRHDGETVAAVAAETPYQAWDAVRAIKVDYEVLPFVVDEVEALKPGAPRVREGDNKRATDVYERGDLGNGFREADVVLEESYKIECQFHNCPEPQGCVASWDGDYLTVWCGVQGVFLPTQAEITGGLGLPLSKCRVISKYNGGGYGGKTHVYMAHFIAPLLAKKTGRPVKIAYTREENFADGGNTPPHNMKVKAGVKKKGTLTAFSYSTINTGGSLSSGGIFWYDRPIRDLYLCPNLRTEGTDVYVNASHSWPFRAPCHPQATFASEQMMDQLAEAIGMDPVELRLKNIPTYAQDIEGNPPYTTTGLKECIADGAKAFGWKDARRGAERTRNGHIRRGVGMAAGSFEMAFIWGPTTPIIKLCADGTVNLNIGSVDLGTGTKTALSMVIAEELGIKPEFVQIEHADTATTGVAQVSAGSRTIPTDTPAVREAAIKIKQQLLDMAAKDLKVDVSELVVQGGQVVSTRDRSKKVKFTDISGLKAQQVIVGVAHAGANPAGKRVKPFCAHFCEVEVDMKTMEVKILRYVAAHDSGRVIYRVGYDAQVFGGVVQGIGHVMTEARILDRQTGKLLGNNMHDYKVPTIKDVPTDMACIPIDKNDTFSSTGAKGLGEPPKVPPPAALANAIYHATGIRFTKTPINTVQLRA